MDIISNAPKGGEFLRRSGAVDRVVDGPVFLVRGIWKDRAARARIPAEGDHIVDVVQGHIAERFGVLGGDIHPRLAHDGDGRGMHARRYRPGALHAPFLGKEFPGKAFSHLRAARVSRAYEEN